MAHCQSQEKSSDQVLVYERGKFIFVFNFNGVQSFTDYGILANKGAYKIVLNTDNQKFGGFNLIDEDILYNTIPAPDSFGKEWLKLYIPARTAIVLKKQ